MVRLNLSLDDVGDCEETTASLRKGSSIWSIYKDLYLKNPMSLTSLAQVKLVKLLEKCPKLKVVMNFK